MLRWSRIGGIADCAVFAAGGLISFAAPGFYGSFAGVLVALELAVETARGSDPSERNQLQQ
jgi:hypothetical protein